MEIPTRGTRTLIFLSIFLGLCLTVAVVYYKNDSALSSDTITIQRAEASERHVYGNKEAPVKMIEFSDYQCPFCAKLHPQLKRLVDESDGQISWEYRHLPLPNHPLAHPAAVMLECIAEQLGEKEFWLLTDTIYENQHKLTAAFLHENALKLGLKNDQILACEFSEAIAAKIETDYQTARTLGGTGTPFTVILYPDDTYKGVVGAHGYEDWLALTEAYVK